MCDLGVHANLIVPPSWVVKLPPKRVSHFFFICLNLNCSCPPQTPHFVSEHVYHASLSIFSWMVLFFRILILIVQTKVMYNSSYCLKLSSQLSYFLWYIVLTAFLFATRFPSCTFEYHIAWKKQWNLGCYPFWVYVLFFMLKARGSSMKRGSFNKKRSIKRKSTKVCVVIIKNICCCCEWLGPICRLPRSQLSLCHWSQQYDVVWTFDFHWCINQFRWLQSVTVHNFNVQITIIFQINSTKLLIKITVYSLSHFFWHIN